MTAMFHSGGTALDITRWFLLSPTHRKLPSKTMPLGFCNDVAVGGATSEASLKVS